MSNLSIEERIWEYIDGVCTDTEKADIESLVRTNPEWKTKYDELLQMHKLIGSTGLEEPSMRFTQNVMEEIAQLHIAPATKLYLDKKVIYGIGGFFMIMIVGLLIYGMAQINWAETGQSATRSFNLNDIEWNKLYNNTYTTIFMMVNVILGLMLLDKYLGRKKNNGKHKAA